MKPAQLITLLFTMLILACTSEEKPPNLIDEDVYIDLLVEMQIIKSQAYIEPELKVDSLRIEVLNFYGLTKAEFLQSHEYYQSEGKAQVERIEEAIERVKELEAKVIREKNDN